MHLTTESNLDKNGFPSRKHSVAGAESQCDHQQIRSCCEVCHARAAGLIPKDFDEKTGPFVDPSHYDWDKNGRKYPKNETLGLNSTV
jgi:hypothetical protein